jgi:hypothetical protein
LTYLWLRCVTVFSYIVLWTIRIWSGTLSTLRAAWRTVTSAAMLSFISSLLTGVVLLAVSELLDRVVHTARASIDGPLVLLQMIAAPG